jgi:adenylosuccinate synthase
MDGEARVVVVDAVRIKDQVDGIRRAFGTRVTHIHLTAPFEILERRYAQRRDANISKSSSYAEVRSNKTEQEVGALSQIADIVIDSHRCTVGDVLARAISHLGVHKPASDQLVDVVVGGQYGSEGKGQVAAYLSPEYGLLVRVGGPNAGHTVYEEPASYTHHHLPSGTRRCSAQLLIGPGAVVDVQKLLGEIADCGVDKDRLSIDPQAMVISPEDILFEKDLVANIGSTGQGVGAATARRIIERGKGVKLARDMPELKPFIRPALDVLSLAYANRTKILLEGTQGTGLSLYHGSYPHVTSRDTGVAGCLAEAGISPTRVRRVVMVCRTYPIRVQSPRGGTSGFMSGELNWAEISRRSGIPVRKLRLAEKTSTTRRSRRVGEFEWVLLRKSALLNGPTDVALTFVDYLCKSNESAKRFEQLTPDTINFIREVECVAGCQVSLISTGFNSRPIIDLRSW